MRFLIDECLTPALVDAAHRAGHTAYHIAHIGQASAKDWSVVSYALAHDLILVTNNASDFQALYARRDLHPGMLIIIPSVGRETQVQLFEVSLAKLAEIGEPVNRVIEVHLERGSIRLELYQWPAAPT